MEGSMALKVVGAPQLKKIYDSAGGLNRGPKQFYLSNMQALFIFLFDGP